MHLMHFLISQCWGLACSTSSCMRSWVQLISAQMRAVLCHEEERALFCMLVPKTLHAHQVPARPKPYSHRPQEQLHHCNARASRRAPLQDP
jgi:hypothetical protein